MPQADKDPVVSAAKSPPHSIEAEQAVIGSLLFDNNAWDAIADILLAEDFYRHEHGVIFESITELVSQNKPFDGVTVIAHLSGKSKLEDAGGEVFIYELLNQTGTAENIKAYAEIIRERAIRRRLIAAARHIADSAYQADGRDINDLLDGAEREIFAIAENRMQGEGPQPVAHYLAKATERLDKLFHSPEALSGCPTRFTDLDKMTSGLQPADLIIVAGRPSMGKTMLAMNIAESVALGAQLPVLVFSLEMPGESLAMRLLSSLGRLDQHKLRSGKMNDQDWQRVISTVNQCKDTRIFIDDTPALTPTEMRARARRAQREHGQLGLIVVDYLQLMRIPSYADNRVGEISEISRSLKTLAKELNVPLIALSQLNRSLESRQDKRPVMSDLRESGAIEQDADIIIFIYRDEVYNKNSPDKGSAEIIIAKHRNGPTGQLRLSFKGSLTRFENYSPEHPAIGVNVGPIMAEQP